MVSSVRKSIISGTWYPGDPATLRKMIHGYIHSIPNLSLHGDILGLVSPHAGYMYSGQIAAWGYKAIQNSSIQTVFILSPLHHLFAGKYTFTKHDLYETPLGTVPVDMSLIAKIAKRIPLTPISFDNEHSIEIQLPFLQMVLTDFSIVPIMIGNTDVHHVKDLIDAIVEYFPIEKGLIIASSDLHHIDNFKDVVMRDKTVLDALVSMDSQRIKSVFDDETCSVCGKVPITVAIEAAKKMGANSFQSLKYANSGDVTGNRTPGQYTVGYLSAAILKKPK